MSKAASFTFHFICKAIAALFFIPYCRPIWRHCQWFFSVSTLVHTFALDPNTGCRLYRHQVKINCRYGTLAHHSTEIQIAILWVWVETNHIGQIKIWVDTDSCGSASDIIHFKPNNCTIFTVKDDPCTGMFCQKEKPRVYGVNIKVKLFHRTQQKTDMDGKYQ